MRAPAAAGASRSRGAGLKLVEVSKRYAEQVAVEGVSLEIEAGEFVTLLGPSGSGKTTMLNLIAGFVEADSGDILLEGKPISRLPPHKRNIGMVFQNYALFPHMTASENVAFPLRQRRVKKAEISRRVEEALALVHLESFAARYPRQLSGGQQQRVALARAIVFNPRVLLMDEPLGALDKKLREALQLEIKRIHRELGITFIYVTHDQEEALVMSDRIAILNEGRIIQLGPAAELYERPVDIFVADFLGESNLFTGRLTHEGGRTWLRTDTLGFQVRTDRAASNEARVVIRPERLRLVPADGPRLDGRNDVEGEVEDVIYLGNTKKYAVALNSSKSPVVVRAQVGSEAQAFDVGERVRVVWPYDAAVVLPEDGP